MPNVPTYRCGDPDERQYVLEHIGELVVKPSNESGGYGIVIGGRATEALEVVKRRIASSGTRRLGGPADACTFDGADPRDGSVAPRHVDLRPFTLLGPEGAYVTPGGLTRVARQEGSLIVNSSQGGGSKDTWVVSGAVTDPGLPRRRSRHGRRPAGRASPAEPANGFGPGTGRRGRAGGAPGRAGAAVEGRDVGRDVGHELARTRAAGQEMTNMLLARTAESVYWAGRYLERAEDMARIVLVHGDTHVDLPVGEDIGWAPLLEIAGVEHAYAHAPLGLAPHPAEGQRGDIPAREAEVVEFLLFEDDNPSAVLASVSGAREALRLARPAVPREAWELCNDLWLALGEQRAELRTPRRPGAAAAPRHRRLPAGERSAVGRHAPRRGDGVHAHRAVPGACRPDLPAAARSEPTTRWWRGGTTPTTRSAPWGCCAPSPPTSPSATRCRPGRARGRRSSSCSATRRSRGRWPRA